LVIPLPSVNHQRQIVETLQTVQTRVMSLQRRQTQLAAEVDALLPSILDRAFKGAL
jgi:type I restriction enzyme S subunit